MKAGLNRGRYCGHTDCNDDKCCDTYYMKKTGRMTEDGTYNWKKILGKDYVNRTSQKDREWQNRNMKGLRSA